MKNNIAIFVEYSDYLPGCRVWPPICQNLKYFLSELFQFIINGTKIYPEHCWAFIHTESYIVEKFCTF